MSCIFYHSRKPERNSYLMVKHWKQVLWNQEQHRDAPCCHCIQEVVETEASVTRQEKERTRLRIKKKGTERPFVTGRTMYQEDPKDAPGKVSELITEFNKSSGYKDNIQSSIVLLFTCVSKVRKTTRWLEIPWLRTQQRAVLITVRRDPKGRGEGRDWRSPWHLPHALSLARGSHSAHSSPRKRNATTRVWWFCLREPIRASASKVCTGDRSRRHPLPSTYQNARLWEGTQAFGLNHSLREQSKHSEPPVTLQPPSSRVPAEGRPCKCDNDSGEPFFAQPSTKF